MTMMRVVSWLMLPAGFLVGATAQTYNGQWLMGLLMIALGGIGIYTSEDQLH